MQSQSKETDHFDPVVALVQMGSLMFQYVFPPFFAHAQGDLDPGLDKAENKGGIDAVTFPAAPDADGFLNLLF